MFTHRKLAYCKTGEAAELLGVSLRTVQLWVDAGILEAWLTEGGHRRIRLSSVNRLLNSKTGLSELLPTLPESLEPNASPTQTPPTALTALLAADDEEVLRQLKRKIESWHLPIDVSWVTDGYEALLRVGRETPDLLVTSPQLSGMDRSKMISTLAQSNYSSRTTLAVLTSDDAAEPMPETPSSRKIHCFSSQTAMTSLRKLMEQMIAQRSVQ